MKTIATISTPIASGAIGIIRMSGDGALEVADKIFTTTKLKTFKDAVPNMMYLGNINCGKTRDKGFAVFFKSPQSYTGEDVVEFQCHGGARLVKEALYACVENGAEIADKGEFTKRAFLNGKMALSDAEGVIDMINAESIAALNAGYRLLEGGVAKKVDGMQARLLDAIAQLEASLDYPDEMEEESKSGAAQLLEQLCVELKDFRQTASVGEICKNGIAVAIVGQANVGKSSLLNTLLGRERAIVTDIAGTTRDSVEENVEVDGVLLRLIDTAGIRETQDKVEAIGIERSLQAAKNSDIVLFLTTANRKLNDEERQLLVEIEKSGNQKILIVRNKCDLLAVDNEKDLIDKTSGDNILTNGFGAIVGQNEGGFDCVTISCKNKLGIDELRQKIVAMFHVELLDGNVDIITNERHKVAISKAIENIDHANATLAIAPTECLLVDLRTAYFALGEITGNTANEDIIDKIFSKFCLGK